MKYIAFMIKRHFFILKDTPRLRRPISTIWVIWLIGVVVVFGIAFANELFSPQKTTTFIFLACGMVPVTKAFSNKRYVELQLKKYYKNLLGYLYSGNLTWMVLGTTTQVIYQLGWSGDVLLIITSQSTMLLLWFLTIPCALVYNQLYLGICVTLTFAIAFAYKEFLEWYFRSFVIDVPMALVISVGIVLISAAVSIKISKERIKALFGKDDLNRIDEIN